MDVDSRIETLCKVLCLTHIPRFVNTHEFDTKETWLLSLLESELECREETKKLRLYKQAKFPIKKELASYEWHEHISLPNETTKQELTSLSFIDRCENVVLVGTPGTGKTHLALALGVLATSHSVPTKFWRVSDLMGKLSKHWANGTLKAFKKSLDSIKLIILDEMGYIPFTKEGAELLFEFVSDWYETKSVIITSNLEFSAWSKVFVDARLTAALVDRLIHHAHIIRFTGESYRLKNALSSSR